MDVPRGTWVGWNLQIGSKAYTAIRPLAFEVRRQAVDHSTGFWFWKKTWKEETDKWEIVMTYDRGPTTLKKKDYIEFYSSEEAYNVYNELCRTIFNLPEPTVTPPKKPKKSKPNLKLV